MVGVGYDDKQRIQKSILGPFPAQIGIGEAYAPILGSFRSLRRARWALGPYPLFAAFFFLFISSNL